MRVELIRNISFEQTLFSGWEVKGKRDKDPRFPLSTSTLKREFGRIISIGLNIINHGMLSSSFTRHLIVLSDSYYKKYRARYSYLHQVSKSQS